MKRKAALGIGTALLALGTVAGYAALHLGPPGAIGRVFGIGEPMPVATVSAVPYAHQSASQVFNLYLPKGGGPFPVVVMVHGGAFLFGDQKDPGPGFKADVDALNGRGIAVASIGYRLSGEAVFPAAVQDVKGAIRYLRSHAGTYRLDGARIALWGKSAGANLVLMAGLAHGVPAFDNPQVADPAISDRVSAIVTFYAPTDFLAMDAALARRGCVFGSGPFGPHNAKDSPESQFLGKAITQDRAWTEQANPANHVAPDAPPVLLEAGLKDCTVPPDQSQLMFNALLARAPASHPRIVLLDNAQHADPVFDQGESLQRVVHFLAEKLARS